MTRKDKPIPATFYNLLECLNVRASFSHIENTLSDHPDYPSVLSIVETLPEWNVRSEGVGGTVDDLTEADYPSIVQLAPKPDLFKEFEGKPIPFPTDVYVVLESIRDGNAIINSPTKGRQTLALEDFARIWSGILIRAYPEEGAGEKNFEKHAKNERLNSIMSTAVSYGIPLLILIGFVAVFWNASHLSTLIPLALAKVVGFILCAVMTAGSIGKTDLLSSLCPMGRIANCHRVMHSPAGKIFGIPMADIGLVYFGGGLLALLFWEFGASVESVLFWLGCLNLITLPYTIFSVSYQAFVIRSWCWMCLVVQSLFWCEFYLCYSFTVPNLSGIDWFSSVPLLLILLLTIMTWIAIKEQLGGQFKAERYQHEINRLRRKPVNIQSQLNESDQTDLGSFPVELCVGNPEAPIRITSLVNPLCSHCGRSMGQLVDLIGSHNGRLRATIRFLVLAKADKNTEIEQRLDLEVSKVVLTHAAMGHQSRALTALRQWFASEESSTKGKYDRWIAEFGTKPDKVTATKVSDSLSQQVRWAIDNKIMATPTVFINNTELPSGVELADLKYFFIRMFSEK